MSGLKQLSMMIVMLMAMTVCRAQANFDLPKVAKQQRQSLPQKQNSVSPKKVTPKLPTTIPESGGVKKVVQKSTDADMRQLSDYQLELKAYQGDAQAQYLLGRRWVLKGDSVSVAKGVNQLKAAARRGNREAQAFLKNHQL